MAVTRFQSEILKLLARSRIRNGDRAVLKDAGYKVELKRERDYIVEVTVEKDGEVTDIQWVQDSAYRFFPLVVDEMLGLTLHPFDLATNKLLALAGRRVPRDWVDTISCSEDIQPLGLLVWAANGKDPGLTPNFILEMCARTTYVQKELEMVVRSEKPVDAADLSRKWHVMIERARATIKLLPPEEVGKVVMMREGGLFRGTDDELKVALAAGDIVFHEGVIGGAWPTIVET